MALRLGDGENIDLVLGDTQAKKLLTRVTNTENCLKSLYMALEKYLVTNSSVTDKLDEVAKVLINFAHEEELSTTTKLTMATVPASLFSIGKYRNLYAKQIEEHAFPLLSSYERIGKRMRSIIRAGKSAQEKAEQRKKELVKISEKAPSKGVVEAERELYKALTDVSRLTLTTNEEMVNFEYKKANDIKQCLLVFLKSEMTFHARALEVLTDAVNQVNNLDPKVDMQILKSGMALHGIQPLLTNRSSSEMQRKCHVNKRQQRRSDSYHLIKPSKETDEVDPLHFGALRSSVSDPSSKHCKSVCRPYWRKASVSSKQLNQPRLIRTLDTDRQAVVECGPTPIELEDPKLKEIF